MNDSGTTPEELGYHQIHTTPLFTLVNYYTNRVMPLIPKVYMPVEELTYEIVKYTNNAERIYKMRYIYDINDTKIKEKKEALKNELITVALNPERISNMSKRYNMSFYEVLKLMSS